MNDSLWMFQEISKIFPVFLNPIFVLIFFFSGYILLFTLRRMSKSFDKKMSKSQVDIIILTFLFSFLLFLSSLVFYGCISRSAPPASPSDWGLLSYFSFVSLLILVKGLKDEKAERKKWLEYYSMFQYSFWILFGSSLGILYALTSSKGAEYLFSLEVRMSIVSNLSYFSFFGIAYIYLIGFIRSFCLWLLKEKEVNYEPFSFKKFIKNLMKK